MWRLENWTAWITIAIKVPIDQQTTRELKSIYTIIDGRLLDTFK